MACVRPCGCLLGRSWTKINRKTTKTSPPLPPRYVPINSNTALASPQSPSIGAYLLGTTPRPATHAFHQLKKKRQKPMTNQEKSTNSPHYYLGLPNHCLPSHRFPGTFNTKKLSMWIPMVPASFAKASRSCGTADSRSQ